MNKKIAFAFSFLALALIAGLAFSQAEVPLALSSLVLQGEVIEPAEATYTVDITPSSDGSWTYPNDIRLRPGLFTIGAKTQRIVFRYNGQDIATLAGCWYDGEYAAQAETTSRALGVSTDVDTIIKYCYYISIKGNMQMTREAKYFPGIASSSTDWVPIKKDALEATLAARNIPYRISAEFQVWDSPDNAKDEVKFRNVKITGLTGTVQPPVKPAGNILEALINLNKRLVSDLGLP